MPTKKNQHSSYGQKIVTLFARLLFSKEKFGLIELARQLDCSKQTVMRLIADINQSYGVEVVDSMVGRRKYYQLRQTRKGSPQLSFCHDEVVVLQMCKAFTEHLLGKELFSEASLALDKSQYLHSGSSVSPRHFGSFLPGSVDYTPHQQTIRTLIEAMEERKVCKIFYKGAGRERAISFYIQPFKLFSHQDTLYLHAGKARTPGKPFKEAEYNPLLVVHRIKQAELTDTSYRLPDNYDFEQFFNQSFGIIKEDAFVVELEFSGYAAIYVAERIWSPDLEIEELSDGKIRLKFSASSVPELVGWIMWWGDEVKVVGPEWLVAEVVEMAERVLEKY